MGAGSGSKRVGVKSKTKAIKNSEPGTKKRQSVMNQRNDQSQTAFNSTMNNNINTTKSRNNV